MTVRDVTVRLITYATIIMGTYGYVSKRYGAHNVEDVGFIVLKVN
jgi:hypothetical protein